MAPLPENNTPRFWLDYNDGRNDHSLMVRYAASAGTAAAMDFLDAFLTALSADLFLLTVQGARASASGSNISLPVAWTGAASYGADPLPLNRRPFECRFLSRSVTGRRGSMSVYGTKFNLPDEFRIARDADPQISNAFSAWETAISNLDIIAIDFSEPIPYPYVSINYNSYWEQESRL